MNKEKIKTILKKIIQVIINIIAIIGFGVTAIFLFDKTKKENITPEEKAEEKKEEKKNELEKMDPDSIIADSNKTDDVQSGIEHEQSEFRKRVRDRLK